MSLGFQKYFQHDNEADAEEAEKEQAPEGLEAHVDVGGSDVSVSGY